MNHPADPHHLAETIEQSTPDLDAISIVVTMRIPDDSESDLLEYPWVIGPFPRIFDLLTICGYASQIAEALTARYPDTVSIGWEIATTATSTEILLDLDALADRIVNEHRSLDPEIAHLIDDAYVREILDGLDPEASDE